MMTPPLINLFDTERIYAFTSLRGDCKEEEPYSGFNTCLYTGQDPGVVWANRRSLCKHLGIAAANLITPRQTHSDKVTVIDRIPCAPSKLEGTDAIVTTLKGVALCVHTADCVPLVMADEEAGVIAAVHSGWRGTVARIARNAVDVMKELGASPERIKAAMGPCIGPECFEVGQEVLDRFLEAHFPQEMYFIKSNPEPKPHIILSSTVAWTLIECGVKYRNISLSVGCSRCAPNRYFSTRRLGIRSGRNVTGIMMR
ncbi:MAG: peptidoglycan editing factor PgeF [Muribaculaceae bacterium]|nr:peptidoglycan editing factor PgeF [Muribaculaceae bacterium]